MRRWRIWLAGQTFAGNLGKGPGGKMRHPGTRKCSRPQLLSFAKCYRMIVFSNYCINIIFGQQTVKTLWGDWALTVLFSKAPLEGVGKGLIPLIISLNILLMPITKKVTFSMIFYLILSDLNIPIIPLLFPHISPPYPVNFLPNMQHPENPYNSSVLNHAFFKTNLHLTFALSP